MDGAIERMLAGRVPPPRREEPPSDDPVAIADAAVDGVADLLASDLSELKDDRAGAGLRQVGRNLSSAMTALAPYRDSADGRLRAAYAAVHEAITDLAGVYAWLTFGQGRAQHVQRARDRRGQRDERDAHD
ncbi:hypothetical protein [Nocardioides conyzicola]|uniref:Uncharacterized protein n=1 Tax=Nocardioides conyzicola TaxID=1651781 RepID=A0ABP8XT26_9ACTN